ncbi:FkbM family methyltransferase [Bradyrhizobium sp. LB7.2]
MNFMLIQLKSAAKKLPFAPFVRRMLNTFRGRIIHRKTVSIDDRILGSDYGGWSVDCSLLGEKSIVYSFGVGEDISFDLELIRRVGCNVHAFDPTPISVGWIKKQRVTSNLQFHDFGLSGQDGLIEFHVPAGGGGHSFSISAQPDAHQQGIVSCSVKRLNTIMVELGHRSIDLLKMDIEGFEYEVLEDMMRCGLRPRILLVEFHHTYYGIKKEKTLATVKRLLAYNYSIYWVSEIGLEYGLIDSTL